MPVMIRGPKDTIILVKFLFDYREFQLHSINFCFSRRRCSETLFWLRPVDGCIHHSLTFVTFCFTLNIPLIRKVDYYNFISRRCDGEGARGG